MLPYRLTSHYKVSLLMPCSRHRSGALVLASFCLSIAKIWLSKYLDFLIENFLFAVYKNPLLLTPVNLRGDYNMILSGFDTSEVAISRKIFEGPKA